MKYIVSQHDTKVNFLAALSARDLETEIRQLEDQVAIQRAELRDLEDGHRARPYRAEFMTHMRRGYRLSLRQLHSQIETVREMLDKCGASVQL